MPYDRAQRPDHDTGDQAPASGDGSAGSPSIPDIRGAGTYFLGRYRVVDEIGIGGMASVHLARMDGPGGFQKWVAIKRIHSHLIEDETFIQMFLDEARVAARISHPNVATVFELGKHEDTYWIAMEYLHGEPLREVMRRTEETGQPMPPEIACRVIADAAEGLHAAHELLGKNGEKLQLVHRDVTPHNLFVTYDGCTKVVDFGIAKFSSRMSNTRAGTLKGKLAYMSPEQVHGEGIDRRTDIFALGVVLWELTTGHRLFRMESDLDTLAKVQECNVPRPSTMVRGYPIDLEKIVMKALSKNRGERFRTAREFSRALQSLLMRRGLFIASDEVASYVQTIFTERIQKREAHLRWAADVTQTINLDGMLAQSPMAAPQEQSLVTFNSEVQAAPSTTKQAPRPAAGMPALPRTPPISQQYIPRAPAAGSPSPDPRPHASRETARPMGAVPPPPGMGIPAMPVIGMPSGHDPDDDIDGPTIQALPGMNPAANMSYPAAFPDAQRRERSPSEPPDRDEPPTMQALTGQRAVMIAAMVQAEAKAENGRPDGPPKLPTDDFDDENDGDDTIVTLPRSEGEPGGPAVYNARPIPAAGRPARDDRLNMTKAMGGDMPPTQGFMPPRPTPRASSTPSPSQGGATPPPGRSDPYLRGGPPARLQAPPPPIYPNDGYPMAPQQQHPPQPQLYAPPQTFPPQPRPFSPPISRHARTETARSAKRRVPMWLVGLASGTLFLMVVAVVFFIATHPTREPALGDENGSGSSPVAKPAATTAPRAAGTATVAAPIPGGGPFANARSGFIAAIAAPPGALNAPPSVPANVVAPTTPTPDPTPAPIASAAPVPVPVATPDPPPTPVAAAPQAAPQAPTPTPSPPTTASSVAASARPKPVAPAPAAPPPTSKPVAAGGTGLITIICFPVCDQVIDNGKPLGPSPIYQHTVPAGEHRLKLTTSNPPSTKIQSVIVAADELKTVKQTMGQ